MYKKLPEYRLSTVQCPKIDTGWQSAPFAFLAPLPRRAKMFATPGDFQPHHSLFLTGWTECFWHASLAGSHSKKKKETRRKWLRQAEACIALKKL